MAAKINCETCKSYGEKLTTEMLNNVKSRFRSTHKLDRLLDGTLDTKYHSEENRLKTFNCWPIWSPVPPSSLASQGFVYDDSNFLLDQVVCVFCQTCFNSWEYCEDPHTSHKKKVPNCPFVLGSENTTNIPMDEERSLNMQYEFLGSTKPTWYAKHIYQGGRLKVFTYETTTQPKHPHFANKITRVASFGNQKFVFGSHPVDVICDDGFFSSTLDEKIICFHCNLIISTLQTDENIHTKHCTFSPNCCWILQSKTQCPKSKTAEKITRDNIIKVIDNNTSIRKESSTYDDLITVLEYRMESEVVKQVKMAGFPEGLIIEMLLEKHQKSHGTYEDKEQFVQLLQIRQKQENEKTMKQKIAEENVSSSVAESVAEYVTSLKKEIECLQTSYDNDTLCHICYETLFDFVFIPCGHVLCVQCSENLKGKTICCVCKTLINGTNRVRRW